MGVAHRAQLRALAHPLRLQMLSLLTATPASAAELARGTGSTQANASYHLRTLEAAGLIEVDSERSVRGGRERRYRVTPLPVDDTSRDLDEGGAWPAALAAELQRRWPERVEGPRTTSDAELWVDPQLWEGVVDQSRTPSCGSTRARSRRTPRAPCGRARRQPCSGCGREGRAGGPRLPVAVHRAAGQRAR